MSRSRRVLAVACALMVVGAGCTEPGSSPPEPNPPIVIDRLTSAADGSVRLRADSISVPRAQGSTTTTTPAPTVAQITVDPEKRYQEVDGFGAALTEASAWLIHRLPDDERTKALRALFDPEVGAGLSVVRLAIGASDFAREHYTYDDSLTPDPELEGFSIDPDREAIIPVAKEILRINPNVVFIGSPWSPPAWMKDSGDLTRGHLLPQYQPAFAEYLVRFVQAYARAGIPVSWLTIVNEPEFEPLSYPGMAMSAAQQTDFLVEDLGPALVAAGLDTKVLLYDHNWDNPAYPLEVLDGLSNAGDEGAAEVVGGVAFHCYRGDQAAAHEALHEELGFAGKIWQTECSGGSWQGKRAAAFFGEADLFIEGLESRANASLLWNLALDPDSGPHTGGCGTCRGVITVDGSSWKPNLDLDVVTHMSRWASGGAVRVDSSVTGAAKVTATAMRTGSEHVVLVVANPGDARPTTVRSGALRFRLDLPARSMVTVRWRT